ncbi:MAG: AEC family transporter [Bacteroidales bacterium]|nr:AEC family transporter [Bacteroidales bacterium]
MHTVNTLFEGVVVMFAIIFLAFVLKKMGVLKKEDSQLFSKIVLQITLPAVIFSSLAVQRIDKEFIVMAGIMAAVELAMMVLAWLLAQLLKLGKGETGALILVSAFGMTSMLGYPIISEVFNNSPLAMEEAVVTSEIGVGLLLFVLGPLIAMYYGDSQVEGKDILQSVKKFFVSPIFIALVVGIIVSLIPFNEKSPAFVSALRFFKLIGNANLLMVALAIGLLLEMKHLKHAYVIIGIAILLKLFMKPLMAYWLTGGSNFTDMMREIVLIETALPSAILTAVFANHYKCRPDLVTVSIMTTLVLSLASMSLLFVFLF